METDSFKEDILFLEAKKDVLRDKYPDRWVAVYRKQVVQVGDSLEQVIEQLKNKDIDPGQAVIDFLATEESTLVLAYAKRIL